MDLCDVHALVDRAGVSLAAADRDATSDVVDAIRQLRAWTESVQVAVARRVADFSHCPEALISTAGRVTMGDANRIVERANTAAEVPMFDALLADGKVAGGHVDALGRGMRQLPDDGRQHLAARAPFLASMAEQSSPEQFDRIVREEVRHIEVRLGIGTDQLGRQRHQARLRTWIDKASGMWCVNGQFDPVTGRTVDARLRKVMDALEHAGPIPHAPVDPRERTAFVRAHAFAALVEHGPEAGLTPRPAGRGPGTRWRTDVVHVVHRTATAPPTADRRELASQLISGDVVPAVDAPPAGELATMVTDGTARVLDVVIDGVTVVSAPGEVNLNRDARVASPLQRAVLSIWYPTCAIPGCEIVYSNTDLHHIVWWRHNGLTNLDNLVPLCSRHHHQVHDDAWHLDLDAQRVLTVTLPDGHVLRGTVHCNGP